MDATTSALRVTGGPDVTGSPDVATLSERDE